MPTLELNRERSVLATRPLTIHQPPGKLGLDAMRVLAHLGGATARGRLRLARPIDRPHPELIHPILGQIVDARLALARIKGARLHPLLGCSTAL
jgi:hypothetical protein